MRVLWLVLAACGTAHHVFPPDAASDARGDGDAPLAWGERCGNGLDDDGDGLVDEDCTPSLFAGVFAPGVAADPALAQLEAAIGRPLSVVQTYRSLNSDAIGDDVTAIVARGFVAHLNVEPAGYTAADYAAPAADPIAGDVRTMAAQLATALADHPGRVIVTFGAEMNGSWTDWGCLPAATYIALYRAAHDAVAAALAGAGVDARRVRWAYGPNATSSASCGSPAGYYPGHAYVDLLGMSAYRSTTESVGTTIVAPMTALFDALGYPDAWRQRRFVVLQTGARASADRDAWLTSLVQTATADPRIAGLVYFDADTWAIAPGAFTAALAAAPPADRALDGIFAPYFWDVPYDHPAFAEIQGLRDAGVTSGCASDPPRFCPDDPVRAADAEALLARAFAGAQVSLADPVTEPALAGALASLGAAPPAANPAIATRARAAVLIARAARLAPTPF
ncbi:MAG: glycosyl hydrolase [Acidobacteriota bacterium]